MSSSATQTEPGSGYALYTIKKKLLAKVSSFFTAEQISLGRFILHHFIRIHSAYRIKDILTKYTDNTNMVL